MFQVAHLHKQFPVKYRLELQDNVVKRMKKQIRDYQTNKPKPKATPKKGYLSENHSVEADPSPVPMANQKSSASPAKNVEGLAMVPPCDQNEKEAKLTAKKKGYNLKSDVITKCFGLLKLIEQNEDYRALIKIAAQAPTGDNSEAA